MSITYGAITSVTKLQVENVKFIKEISTNRSAVKNVLKIFHLTLLTQLSFILSLNLMLLKLRMDQK